MNVDEFVAERVLPQFQPVVALIRQSLRALLPDAQEVISYGIPTYRLRRIMAVISPTQKDITLSFSRGAQFEDRYGLLKGVGKASKHLKFKCVEDVDAQMLAYYVRQAAAWDEK